MKIGMMLGPCVVALANNDISLSDILFILTPQKIKTYEKLEKQFIASVPSNILANLGASVLSKTLRVLYDAGKILSIRGFTDMVTFYDLWLDVSAEEVTPRHISAIVPTIEQTLHGGRTMAAGMSPELDPVAMLSRIANQIADRGRASDYEKVDESIHRKQSLNVHVGGMYLNGRDDLVIITSELPGFGFMDREGINYDHFGICGIGENQRNNLKVELVHKS